MKIAISLESGERILLAGAVVMAFGDLCDVASTWVGTKLGMLETNPFMVGESGQVLWSHVARIKFAYDGLFLLMAIVAYFLARRLTKNTVYAGCVATFPLLFDAARSFTVAGNNVIRLLFG